MPKCLSFFPLSLSPSLFACLRDDELANQDYSWINSNNTPLLSYKCAISTSFKSSPSHLLPSICALSLACLMLVPLLLYNFQWLLILLSVLLAHHEFFFFYYYIVFGLAFYDSLVVVVVTCLMLCCVVRAANFGALSLCWHFRRSKLTLILSFTLFSVPLLGSLKVC